MRLAIVGSAGVGALATCFANGARDHGHSAEVIDVPELAGGSRILFLARRVGADGVMSKPNVARLRRRLAQMQPDLVLVVKGRFLPAPAVRRLRGELGVPFLNYYPDHPLWPGYDDPQIVVALAEYDEVLLWGEVVADAVRGRGLSKVRVIPFAHDPAVYRPRPPHVRVRWDAAVVGQYYLERLRFAEALAEFDVLVTGLGWSRPAADGPLAGRVFDRSYGGVETCELYWRSHVALNILADCNVPAHNMRTFEIPASGTPMIATRTPEHEVLFGEDGAILVSTPDEARDALQALLEDDELRKATALRGRECVGSHTYAARMCQILEPWSSP